ncbi:MAG: SH3 domain-containing protein [Burkholderiales bacterium]
MRARAARRILALALILFPALGQALDFRSIRMPGAVLYDAPSANAKKLYILSGGYPVEVVVSVEGWQKVRDASGGLAWIPAADLSEEKTVMISVARAAVKGGPSEDVATVFEAEQGVVLRVLDSANGWLKVQHRDGSSGFVRVGQVWGG